MTDTPTMSLRVPHDTDMRRALREAAKALRLGHVPAAVLITWLADQQSAKETLGARIDAIEERLSGLEAAVRELPASSTPGLFRLKANAD